MGRMRATGSGERPVPFRDRERATRAGGRVDFGDFPTGCSVDLRLSENVGTRTNASDAVRGVRSTPAHKLGGQCGADAMLPKFLLDAIDAKHGGDAEAARYHDVPDRLTVERSEPDSAASDVVFDCGGGVVSDAVSLCVCSVMHVLQIVERCSAD